MTKRISLFFASAAAVVLAACGGGDGGPSYVNAADSATIADFADISGDLAQGALYDVFGDQSFNFPLLTASAGAGSPETALARNVMGRMVRQADLRRGAALPARPASLAPRLAAPFSECTPTETGIDEFGDPIDSDGDNIPDDYKLNFGSACVEEDSAGTYRVTYSGSIRIQDISSGFFAFKITVSSLKITEKNLTSGDSYTQTVSGSESASFAAALASHAMNVGLGIAVVSGGDALSLTESVNETSSFDPDGAGTLSLGGGLPSGVFTYNADFRVVGEKSGGGFPGNFRFVLSTTTPLHFNTGCASDIDAGVFRGLLNGGSSVGFTLTWSSCADPVLEIFGDTAPTAVAAR